MLSGSKLPPPIFKNVTRISGGIASVWHKYKLFFQSIYNIIHKEYVRLNVNKDPLLSIKALQSIGVDIADDVMLRENINIDITRPSLVHIGHKVLLHHGFNLLTHDFATRVFLNKYNEFVPSSGRVWIGDNVWFGENVTVLKGAHIGDNCIIGINSVVMGTIPANSVAAGCPAKVICSLEDYFFKRKTKSVEEAFDYARSIMERFGRRPVPSDFWEEFPLFVSGNEVDKYPEIPIRRQLGKAYVYWVENHKATFSSFDDFLRAAGL